MKQYLLKESCFEVAERLSQSHRQQKKQIQATILYAIATAIQQLVKYDNIQISIALLSQIVSKPTAIKLMKQMISAGIFTVWKKAHQYSNTPTTYHINDKYLYSVCDCKIFKLSDYLTTKELTKMQTKIDKFMKSQMHTGLKEVMKQDKSYSDIESELFEARYDLWMWDKQSIIKFVRKQFDNIILSLQQLLDGKVVVKDKKQLRIAQTLFDLFKNKQIKVTIGKNSGRLYHLLCFLNKEVWACLVPKQKDDVKLSIDLNSSQIHCFVRAYGQLPYQFMNSLKQGSFYQYIADILSQYTIKQIGKNSDNSNSNLSQYTTKQIGKNSDFDRDAIKKLCFKQMFNCNKKFWSKFAAISDDCKEYAQQFKVKYEQQKKQGIKTAGVLQKCQSDIFNKIYYKYPNSLIRFDQLVFACKEREVDMIIADVKQQFKQYFGYDVPLHIKIDNTKIN